MSAPLQTEATLRPIEPFRLGEAARPATAVVAPAAPPGMDRRRFERMVRGRLQLEGRIDLHGMTLAEARSALFGFILEAHAGGKRLVLVITGKGRDTDDGGPIPQRRGILRHNVPLWLRQAPLAGVVLDSAEAHRKHGGGGALYVYLRRRR